MDQKIVHSSAAASNLRNQNLFLPNPGTRNAVVDSQFIRINKSPFEGFYLPQKINKTGFLVIYFLRRWALYIIIYIYIIYEYMALKISCSPHPPGKVTWKLVSLTFFQLGVVCSSKVETVCTSTWVTGEILSWDILNHQQWDDGFANLYTDFIL